ncbi:MAG: hypothetical protein HOP04_02095 [Methylophilaceae bacterium]|nr:hypothetical protein [Methylophilaceae bacterium]
MMLPKKGKKSSTDKTLNNYPNQKTCWSYYMQAIEPVSKEINEAFPEYHPMWVISSQSTTVTGKHFKRIREAFLKITQEQCAAYLRIKPWHISAWENEKKPVPFIAFEILRLVYESANFRLSHQDWAGWFITDQGRLVCPDAGDLSFLSTDLPGIHWVKQLARTHELENKRMKAELQPLKEEIKALKEFMAINELAELTNDLNELEAKVGQIIGRINSSNLGSILSRIQIAS